LRFKLGGFLEGEDWPGLIAYYGDANIRDKLTPMLRFFLANAYCRTERPADGLRVASETLVDLEPEALEPGGDLHVAWQNILHANIAQTFKGDADASRLKRELLRKTIATSPHFEGLANLQKQSLQEITEAETMAKLRELFEAKKFAEAVQVIKQMPADSDEAKQRKQELLEQAEGARSQAELHERFEQAAEQCKKLVDENKFQEARSVLKKLPNKPDELREAKEHLLSQVDSAEQNFKLSKQVDDAFKRSQELANSGKIGEAKDVIRRLPNQPEEVKAIKDRLLGQLDEMEQQVRNAKEENTRIVGRLGYRGINMARLMEIAVKCEVDPSNPLQFNAFLKAIEAQK
jgi:hypothetical protein